MTSVSVSVQDNTQAFLEAQQRKIQSALEKMATDAMRSARMTVPRKTGDLSHSGHVEKAGTLGAKAIYGSDKVRYAAKQEVTQFKHYTTPGTGPRYLRKAGDAVQKKGIKAYLV